MPWVESIFCVVQRYGRGACAYVCVTCCAFYNDKNVLPVVKQLANGALCCSGCAIVIQRECCCNMCMMYRVARAVQQCLE